MWLGSDWPPWMVPVITGCFPGLGLSSSSSFPITACVTARAWLGRRSSLQGLGHFSEKTCAGARTSEPGSRRRRPGSGVSAALSCSGAKSDAGLRAEASGRVRSQGGHGSERKDQPGGVDWQCLGPVFRSLPGDCWRGPGDTAASVCKAPRCHGLHPAKPENHSNSWWG